LAGRTFGERLKELREAAGLTQPELAERAGLNRFGIAKLEQGVREPTWATVQALAKALGVRCSAFEAVAEAPTEPPKLGRKRGGNRA
jgi:transcriptional regulator with XRE-family HTH domain